MYKGKKVLCTICARGGSKGVKGKNFKIIQGKPLIAHSIEQALNSKIFEHVVVSTDSDDIAKVAQEYGAEVFFKRPENLAGDSAAKLPVIKHAFTSSEEYYDETYDILVDIDATSPLRLKEDIVGCVDLLIEKECPNVITAAESRRSPYFNLIEKNSVGSWAPAKKLKNEIVRRQDAPVCYDMNASIYVWKRDSILNDTSIFLDDTALYVMPEERSIDIDSPIDFKLVELLLEEQVKNGK